MLSKTQNTEIHRTYPSHEDLIDFMVSMAPELITLLTKLDLIRTTTENQQITLLETRNLLTINSIENITELLLN